MRMRVPEEDEISRQARIRKEERELAEKGIVIKPFVSKGDIPRAEIKQNPVYSVPAIIEDKKIKKLKRRYVKSKRRK